VSAVENVETGGAPQVKAAVTAGGGELGAAGE